MQRRGAAEIQRDVDTINREVKRCRSEAKTEKQTYRDTETQSYKHTDAHRHRETQMQKLRDIELQRENWNKSEDKCREKDRENIMGKLGVVWVKLPG